MLYDPNIFSQHEFYPWQIIYDYFVKKEAESKWFSVEPYRVIFMFCVIRYVLRSV